MKKLLTLAVTFLFLLFTTACSSDNDADMDIADTQSYKIGVASHTSTMDSASSSDTSNGKGVVNTTTVTVILDNNDVIQKVHIDEIETKLFFDALGQLSPTNNGSVQSKKDLGDAYNMKPASSIGKEWYEQIEWLENYLEGKKISDITQGVLYDYSDGAVDNNSGTVDSNLNAGSGEVMGSDSGATGAVSSALEGDSMLGEGVVGDVIDSMTDGDMDSYDSANSGGMTSGTTDGIAWEEDVKSGATIDLTDIKIALKKAYENAR